MGKLSSRRRSKKRSYKRKVYGGTKKRAKKVSRKKYPSKKRVSKKRASKKKHSVIKTRSKNPWLLYSGPRAESMYPGYFKARELQQAKEKRKKVLEDLIKAEQSFKEQRPQYQPQWTPSTLPPADVELQMPYGF